MQRESHDKPITCINGLWILSEYSTERVSGRSDRETDCPKSAKANLIILLEEKHAFNTGWANKKGP